MEQPNGILLVALKDQARMQDRYTCTVIKVLQASSRTCQVGGEIEVERKALCLTWVNQ